MNKWFIILISIASFTSCEDVIEVDLPSEGARLSVDAIIRVNESEEFVPIRIKLSSSKGYFDDITAVSANSVQIIYGVEDDQGFMEATSISNLAEESAGSGIYVPDPNFSSDQRIRVESAQPDVSFYLVIVYNDRTYIGKTFYAPTVPIDYIEQGDDTLFDEEETEIIIAYTDNAEREDFYVIDFDNGNFIISEDTFYRGQQFEFSYFYDDDLNIGDELEISLLGANRDFYNYMTLLLQQTEENFNIFDTPAATIRGNIFDATDIDNITSYDNVDSPDNYALGYFAIVQEYKRLLTIE